ncbi:hypothetical protein HYPSUDRAFT_207080 [Hypholoma sublateritium FD-334 SS-4]|uniref:Uncharacterized protein n=1 Tax=Hypholoma sublateritium (strain FD-334 SS-4) TaxID=945553 RepID=A0A0D2P7M9_HYPSF|nr:hypothetical protein HYPSUDRAFT_207080 [Hypholoma sublateritium FD-334 SS-4]
MSGTEYRTLSFIPKFMPAGDSLAAEVVDDNADICYFINAFSDVAYMYHERSINSGRVILVFRPFADKKNGAIQTVSLRGKREELVGSLLTSLSAYVLLLLSPSTRTILITASFRRRKVLTTSCMRYEWVFTTTGHRSWVSVTFMLFAQFLTCLRPSVLPHAQYEILDPLVGHNPLARLRIVDGMITLELNNLIAMHCELCDCIVAGVFLMCLNRDAWVKDALLRLR